MNAYAILVFGIVFIICVDFLNLGPPIQTLFMRLADIPPLTSKGNSPAVFDFAVRCAYLIALVGIIRIIFSNRKDRDE